jgi:hypothetical protein
LLKALAKVFTKFILVGITIVSNLLQPLHILDIDIRLFCALFGSVMEVILLQLLNAVVKLVIFHADGIVILDKEKQVLKALTIVIVEPTVAGRVTEFNEAQPLKQLVISVKLGDGGGNVTLVKL